MDIESENVIYIFAALALVIGGYSTTFGKLTFYPGEDQSMAQSLKGAKARFVGIIMLLASLLLFFSNTLGYVVLVVSILLPLVLSESRR